MSKKGGGKDQDTLIDLFSTRSRDGQEEAPGIPEQTSDSKANMSPEVVEKANTPLTTKAPSKRASGGSTEAKSKEARKENKKVNLSPVATKVLKETRRELGNSGEIDVGEDISETQIAAAVG